MGGCGSSSSSKPEAGSSNNSGNKAGQQAGKQVKPDQVVPSDKPTEKQQAKEENKEYQAKMDFLSKVPLLKRLPRDEFPILASNCNATNFAKGANVIEQGSMGDTFFVIKTGEAAVHINTEGGGKKQVATLKPGDYFGENALLRDEPRSATITAESDMICYKITRAEFQQLGLHEKLQFANRKAVGAGAITQVKAKEPTPKTDEDRTLISKALRSNANLQTMVKLDDARVNAMIDCMWKEDVAAGEEIIKENDLNADYFYIVSSGSFEITTDVDGEDGGAQSAEKAAVGGEEKVVGQVPAGGSFGELALLYFVPRAATVKAKEKAVVFVIDRGNFKNILMMASDDKLAQYEKYLENCQILAPLVTEEKKEVAKALIEMHFNSGEVVLQQGEPGNTFYILYEGKVKILKDGNEVNVLEASTDRKTSQVFGEQALLDSEVRKATVVVTSNTAKALVLDRESFNMLLGPLKNIIEAQNKDGGKRKSMVNAGMKAVMAHDKPRQKILRKELKRIGLLGCGGFGTVELYEHVVNGDTYAMKGLSKGYIVKSNMQDSVMNEKNILMMTNSPFIIKLFECYNGSQTLYFLMEPALGGELYATYNRKGFHGSEKHAKFYAAGVVYAFEHCHERRIIYRDLKPENLLLNDSGQIKLTDMGLAKFVIGKTYTTCGTPDYFAPELIASTGHTNAVDWWTLGILVFELMSGHPPFESAYPMQIYSKVMKGISKVPFPPKCQGPVGDLIKALLKKEPSERLPMRPGGTKNVRDHKWYSGFDWTSMKGLTLDPPYKPVVKSKKDIANFSARKEDMPRQIEYKDDGTGWDKDFAT
mmetsp:Transcript_130916/g.245018  ORF Transcript_130916/g.245018 Transcript_130916/m.245018 type:complete len:820 (-) Transcript_130916:263-2722(-)